MTYLLHTYGCQMNVRDSEMAAAILESSGLEPARGEDDADLILINTCAVRGKAEDKAIGKARLLCAQKKRRPLLVGFAGCMAQRLGPELFRRVPRLDFAIGTRAHAALPDVLRRLQNGEPRVAFLDPPFNIPDNPCQHLAPKLSAYVTILLGCNRRCAYCVVPDVRGPEYSRPAAEILGEARALVNAGAREITLLGQSVMRYGALPKCSMSNREVSEPFPRLLRDICQIPGLARLRFTSGHPSGCTPGLLHAFRTLPQLCHHLHLPVQSGSDKILAAMRRGYTRGEYLDTLRRLRDAVPDIAITSDIIVGFPGETGEDFAQTHSLLREAAFDNTFIFKFSPRPGTPAALLDDDVTDDEKMRRNKILLEEQDRVGQALNDKLLHTTQQILVEGPSLRNPSRWAGRTSANKIVHFENPGHVSPGDLFDLTITRVMPQTLYGVPALNQRRQP
ncbi:MAG: tRNA (N6-isopentenyl adenosine(37)-C2)-methylthiotransferase MiaB [Kiritimatiellaeota bacterium]|nr:tRNA (N6-isopentenyl adenosine(37)-C2)-methylthiotransferase MiaB [Kiritimatiellota bacterium]